ncbi:electron transport complex subunit RsxB [Methylibium sp.]|uniref:electron transport complex subunit RsxB n=1 Tax=Methylibium sp. TaxID=2067992 RepID=UPI001846B20D|nr:electron transport complex subunit RsxB [Methylibium sp.]MBA3590241.1 electron transport complex subunit RsxB [Methylibium sp.]
MSTLADAIDAALPQTQCTRCGYPDCRGYAQAIAVGETNIDRCPPGGAEGIAKLAALTGRPRVPLDPACGSEGPLRLAVIDEAACIGCTLCIKACPVDCIVGAAKLMHTVIAAQCTGCELCVPVCPVDCISMEPAGPGPNQPTGWAAWSAAQAEAARSRYRARDERARRLQGEHDERLAARAAPRAEESEGKPDAAATADAGRSAVIEAALARARSRLAQDG